MFYCLDIMGVAKGLLPSLLQASNIVVTKCGLRCYLKVQSKYLLM